MIINPKPMDTISGDELGIMATLGHVGKFDPTKEYICIFGAHIKFICREWH